MFSKVTLLAAAVMAVFVSATPIPGGSPPQTTNVGQCNTGSIHCCNQVYDSTSPEAAGLAGLLSANLINGAVSGNQCSPLGVGTGSQCTQQPVCCNSADSQVSGLVVINCSPINVGL